MAGLEIMGRVVRVDYADPSKKVSSNSAVVGIVRDNSRKVVIDRVERKMTYTSTRVTPMANVNKPAVKRVTSTNVGHIDDDDDGEKDEDDVGNDNDEDDGDERVESLSLDPLEQLMENAPVGNIGSSSVGKDNIYNSRKETSRSGDRSKGWSEDAQRNIRNKQRYEDRSSTSKYGERADDRSKSSPVRPRTRPMTSSTSFSQSSSSYPSSSYSSSSTNRSYSRNTSTRSPSYEATLYFGNLAYAVTEEILKTEIEKFTGDSSVAAVRIATDLETGRKKGFGYVDVFKKEIAAKVIMIIS